VHRFSYSSEIIAPVLLVSVLKTNLYLDILYRLTLIFSNHFYLVSELPSILAWYYAIPSGTWQYEEAKEKLLELGAKLGLAPSAAGLYLVARVP
jgi:hypothetical protein